MDSANYNFAFLDERTKKMIRRATLKAVAIPGYQVPFGSREMPFAYGWGTGGIQVTASESFANTTPSITASARAATRSRQCGYSGSSTAATTMRPRGAPLDVCR